MDGRCPKYVCTCLLYTYIHTYIRMSLFDGRLLSNRTRLTCLPPYGFSFIAVFGRNRVSGSVSTYSTSSAPLYLRTEIVESLQCLVLVYRNSILCTGHKFLSSSSLSRRTDQLPSVSRLKTRRNVTLAHIFMLGA